ncbi:MAG TPA: DNA gyrase subunit A [Chitinophagales bacterium]|nr:DNA gyrase subunit A [Chitinophagales bacterium]
MADGEKIITINIEEEMKTAYIDYSMSVIVARAIPDVRDGLKPVHRRVLYGMMDLGLASNRPHKKSARIVGEVLGKYHPHGDSSVYDAMVRMAQDWSLRYPLVDGQGNFGSLDGDNPAAMRYTEARLSKIAEEMLKDIEKDTVDFQNNFDDTLKEPTVLPSRIPNLLVNGSSGIAVGMATNILPHNLSEVVDGIVAYIDNKEITTNELMQYVKAPDFPTGGVIYGYDGVREAFETGRGKIVVRAKAEIITDEKNDRETIIITEIPYQVNKEELLEKIGELVNERQIEGISGLKDLSNREGIRIEIYLKRDANAQVVLNQLYRFTSLETSFGVNNIALVDGRPQLIGVRDYIKHFVHFRHEVVVRRTKYDLAEAEKRAHILEGLLIALDYLDEVIKLIRGSIDPDAAKEGLMANFKLSEIQSRAILDMRLQRLTGLEREKIKNEYDETMKLIAYLKEILEKEPLRMQIIKDELVEIKKKYGDARRTEIVMTGDEINMEDLIPNEDFVITISHLGYIKRTQASQYRTQGRGGRGSRGGATREEDFIEYIFTATAHQYLLFFTEQGQCYWLKVYEIPEGAKTSKGRPLQNLIQIQKDDKVKSLINVKNLEDEHALQNQYVVLCTKKGVIKKTTLDAYSHPRISGIRAIKVREGDSLIEARLTDGISYIMMATRYGNAIRFPEEKVRPMGRTAAGVRGVTLQGDDDEVVGMICVQKGDKSKTVMVVSEKGFGKRTYLDDPETGEEIYRITNRGGKGVKTMQITEKTGKLIAIKEVTDEDDLMIITKNGITIRLPLTEVRVMGRATQGVILIRLDEGDEIAAVTKVTETNGEEEAAMQAG